MSRDALSLQLFAVASRLGLTERGSRMRELLLLTAAGAATAYFGMSVWHRYPLMALSLLAGLLAILMIQNQKKSLLLMMFFSTVYLTLQATVLGWSNMSFLLKDGFAGLLLAFWFFHFMLRQQKLRRTFLDKPLMVFVFWLGVQCFNPNTYGLMTILVDLRFWLLPIGLYLLTTQLISTRADLEQALRFVFTYAIIESAYGVLQQFMPRGWLIAMGANPYSYFYFVGDTVRSFSTMGTAGFSLFAAMMTPLALFYMSQQKNSLYRTAFAGAAAIFLAGVLLTYVRTGWVAAAAAVAAYAFVSRRWGVVIIVLFVGGLLMVNAGGFLALKLGGFLNPGEDASVMTRLSIIQSASEALAFRAFGYGLGTFAHNRFGLGFTDKTGYGVATENWYLMTALELGWVGILVLAWIGFKIYRYVLYCYRGGLKTDRYRELTLALGTSLLAIDVARLGGPAGYYPPDSWHYWFFIALLTRVGDADRELADEQAAAAAGTGPNRSPALAEPAPAAVAT